MWSPAFRSKNECKQISWRYDIDDRLKPNEYVKEIYRKFDPKLFFLRKSNTSYNNKNAGGFYSYIISWHHTIFLAWVATLPRKTPLP